MEKEKQTKISRGGCEHWDIYEKMLKIVKPKGKVLDAGCGIGRLGEYIEGMIGVDCNEEHLNQVKNKYKKVIKSDLSKLPFKDNEFDTIYCMEVLEYTKNSEQIFYELERITKRGGRIIIAVPNANWINFYYKALQGKATSFLTKTNKRFILLLDQKFKIYYLSKRFPMIRNLFGNCLATEVVGVYTKK